MISKKIVDTDLFLDMPMSSRYLYYELNWRADDDGFVASPKKITKMVGCSDNDLGMLVMKHFIIPFESGICVIKDWRIHNYIQKDRYHETQYIDEKSKLEVSDRNSYELKLVEMDAKCIQPVSIPCPEVRLELGKDRLDKESIEKAPDKPAHHAQKFTPPSLDEVKAYCAERSNSVSPERFVDYYTANGWVQGAGRKPIKDWKACIRTWEQRDKQEKKSSRPAHEPTFDIDAYERSSIYDTQEGK